MHSREGLVAAAALIGLALASFGVLSACTPADKPKPDPSAVVAPAPPDPNDPATLQKAAEVISEWHKKDPTTTAKVLKEQGVLITDPNAIQAIASAAAPTPSAAPRPSVARPAAHANALDTQEPATAPAKPRPSSPMA